MNSKKCRLNAPLFGDVYLLALTKAKMEFEQKNLFPSQMSKSFHICKWKFVAISIFAYIEEMTSDSKCLGDNMWQNWPLFPCINPHVICKRWMLAFEKQKYISLLFVSANWFILFLCMCQLICNFYILIIHFN